MASAVFPVSASRQASTSRASSLASDQEYQPVAATQSAPRTKSAQLQAGNAGRGLPREGPIGAPSSIPAGAGVVVRGTIPFRPM